jgi:hypothetical protein
LKSVPIGTSVAKAVCEKSADVVADNVDYNVFGVSDIGQTKLQKRTSEVCGVLFSTYNLLCSRKAGDAGKKTKKSSSSSAGQPDIGHDMFSRIGQVLQWMDAKPGGVLVFDEAHRAKNVELNQGGDIVVAKSADNSKADDKSGSKKRQAGFTSTSSATGIHVMTLQSVLKDAKVLYASATGISDAGDLAYMTRLGLWGPGTDFPDFKNLVGSVSHQILFCCFSTGSKWRL